MRALFASASEIENQSCRNSQSEDWPMRANENSTSNQLNAGKRLNFASDWLRICREFPDRDYFGHSTKIAPTPSRNKRLTIQGRRIYFNFRKPIVGKAV